MLDTFKKAMVASAAVAVMYVGANIASSGFEFEFLKRFKAAMAEASLQVEQAVPAK